MESLVPKYTLDYFHAEQFLKELEELGVNFEKDDYIYNSDVEKYRTEKYVSSNMVHLSAVYLIEKVFVGQERLEKLYGPYSFSVTRELSEKEIKQANLNTYIADEFTSDEKTLVAKDIYQYFFRKSKSKDGRVTGKAGLIERLQSLGFCVDGFCEDSNRIRLLYHLFRFEHDNDVKLVSFLGNPTLENVDNSFGGEDTRNGILLRKLKTPIYPLMSPGYANKVSSALISVMQYWQEQIKKIRLYVDMANKDNRIQDLDRIDSWLNGYVENLNFDKNGNYEDGILDAFFLKLCQHEYLGNEYDLISVRNKRAGNISLPKYMPGECIKMAYRAIPKDTESLQVYVRDNIDKISCFVYDRETVTDDEKKDILKLADSLNAFIEIINQNTQAGKSKYIQEYMIIAALTEILNPCNKKIVNTFYRYASSDQKKYSAELKNKKKHMADKSKEDAFKKSQIAWADKVCERFDACLGRREEAGYQIKIENNIDRLLIKILSINNVDDMMFIHNHFKTITDIFFQPAEIIQEGWQELANSVWEYYPEYEVGGNDYDAYQLIGACTNTDIIKQMTPQVINLIGHAMTTGQIQKQFIPIELTENYIEESNNYSAIFRADPYEQQLSLEVFGHCFYKDELDILISCGINEFE